MRVLVTRRLPEGGIEPLAGHDLVGPKPDDAPYSPDELYAAGEFQNLGRDNEGLPSWTRANRSIANADVVLWYTLGITHIPRPEDWPYMPAHRGSFRLPPTSFFARNPALDVPANGR